MSVTAEWRKAYPNIDEDNREFWDGLKQHQLLLWHCDECGAWYWPKAYCRNHDNQPFAGQMSWQSSSGKGTIFSANVHNVPFDPNFKEDVPYAYVLVELNEGPLISSMLVDKVSDPVAVIGQPVDVVYEDHIDVENGFTLLKFKLS